MNILRPKSRLSQVSRGFTLIELLAVVAIIGILSTITVVVFGQALTRGRDARRKSDLTAISLGFQARYDAKTCPPNLDPNLDDVGYYPGRSFGSAWTKVSLLSGLSGDCGAFSEYLATVPSDSNSLFPYLFNLSIKSPDGAVVTGKNYRLTAHLETAQSVQQQSDLARIMLVWVSSFGGSALLPNYNYVVGK